MSLITAVPESFDNDLVYYIAGPMSGIEEFNYPAFDHAMDICEKLDIRCMSPHAPFRNDSPELHASRSYQWHISSALRMQLRCDGIILLPGWSTSKGARREFDIALDLGWKAWYLDDYMGIVSLRPLDRLR